jgi:hypothetical protein
LKAGVVPAGSFGHCLSWSPAILAVVRQKLHLSRCPDFPSQLYASPAGLSSALRLGSVIVIFMLMLGPVLMRMLVPVVACESTDGGSARPSDESAR